MMNTRSIIESFIDNNKQIFIKNMSDFENYNEEEVRDTFEELINKIDYRINSDDFLPLILDKTFGVTNHLNLGANGFDPMLSISCSLISAVDKTRFNGIELMYSLLEN